MKKNSQNITRRALGALLAIFLLLPLSSLSAADPPSQEEVDKLLKKMDDLYRGKTSKGVMEMHITTPHWDRTLTMNIWSEGTDNTLVRITAPAKEKGMATLKLDNKMWNYLPKVNKVMKIPASMMMGSWMGSDFTNDDLVKESSYREDYDYKVLSSEDGKLKIELKPKADRAVVWGRIVLLIESKTAIPLEYVFFDEENKPVRTMYFEEVKDFGDRRIPSVLRLKPHAKEGHETVVRYVEMAFNVQLQSNLFSLRSLKSRR